jgi:hypothetical protein
MLNRSDAIHRMTFILFIKDIKFIQALIEVKEFQH